MGSSLIHRILTKSLLIPNGQLHPRGSAASLPLRGLLNTAVLSWTMLICALWS